MRRVRTQQILTCRILIITLLKQSMEYKAEKVTPYGSDESKTQQVQEMFDSIAPAYDFIQELRKHGATLEVLEPAYLREEFRQESTRLGLLYSTEKKHQ